MFDSEDPEGEFVREPPRTSWLPMISAILIVMASISLAVWRLRYEPLVDPPPIREVLAEPAARPRVPPTPVPAATKAPVKPSAPPTAAPTPSAAVAAARTNLPLSTLASAASGTATAAPTSIALLPRPRAASRKDDDRDPPSLLTISPPKVKRGSTTLLDVRGKSFLPGNHVYIMRSGRVPPDIAVPRHRLVNPTLLQVLVIVGMTAPKGDYELRVSNGDGRRSNAVHFEVTP